MYRKLHTTMGLFNFFGGSRTKADIDCEIAREQADLEMLKAHLAQNKEMNKWKNGVHYDTTNLPMMIANKKAKIASLKAQRKTAPK